jgi:uncharacterized membrane protein HdeD (DUF308 family)
MWFAFRQSLILRGLVTIAFGLLLILRPGVSLDVLVLLFGGFALVEGALMLTTAALAARGEPGRAVALLAGGLGVMVGMIAFLWPGLTQLALLIIIALRAVVVGLAELAIAVHIGRQVMGRSVGTWLFGSAGLLSLAFGAVLLVQPGAGLLALVWAIGVYAVLLGLLLITKAWLLTISSHRIMIA